MMSRYIDSVADCASFDQKLTDIFIACKKEFYELIDCQNKQYLGYGAPPSYDFASWQKFLRRYSLSNDGRVGFAEFYKRKLDTIYSLQISGNKTIGVLGDKEIICHEFIRELLAEDVKVLVIIRHPSRIIESLNFGRGGLYTGGIRPTLLNLRNWREVAEIVRTSRLEPNLKFIRYEDFVLKEECRLSVLRFLGSQSNDVYHDLKDSSGLHWSGNSSFVKDDRRSLPIEVENYVEAICYHELRFFGYDIKLNRIHIEDAIRTFREPWEIMQRDYYSEDFSENPKNKEYEIRRTMNLEELKD